MPLAAFRESPATGHPGVKPGPLTSRERVAVIHLLGRVHGEVRAALVQASLFGSRARGDARPDSDLDVLLLFRRLSPSREPQSTHAGRIAGEIADRVGVPVNVWCIALADLDQGRRTPMLVDALQDAVPLWCARRPLRPVPFTPEDALFCVRALRARVREGSGLFGEAIARGDQRAAAQRLRDDVTRLCTAWLLLHGVTRPRRAAAVLAFTAAAPRFGALDGDVLSLLAWARRAWGPNGRGEDWPASLPVIGPRRACIGVEDLRVRVRSVVPRVESMVRRRASLDNGGGKGQGGWRREHSPGALNLPDPNKE